MVEKRGDKMADQKSGYEPRNPNPTARSKGDEENYKVGQDKKADTRSETLPENKEALERVVNLQKSSLTTSPSQEDADLAVPALWSEEKEKDGKTTIATSVSEAEALKVVSNLAAGKGYTNLRAALDGVPGDVDLTSGGTLNSDRSIRIDKTVEEMHALLTKTAGPNPLPNREGNELTKAELGFNARLMVGQGNSLRGYARQLKNLRENGNLKEEDKKVLEDMEKGLLGTSA